MKSRGCSSIQERSVSARCYRRWPAYAEESAEVDASDAHERNSLSKSRNIRSPGHKGSRVGEQYAWSDLMFENTETGEVKNVTDAFNGGQGWIGESSYGELIQIYDRDAETFGPLYPNNLQSWSGYYIYSKNDNVTLLRQD